MYIWVGKSPPGQGQVSAYFQNYSENPATCSGQFGLPALCAGTFFTAIFALSNLSTASCPAQTGQIAGSQKHWLLCHPIIISVFVEFEFWVLAHFYSRVGCGCFGHHYYLSLISHPEFKYTNAQWGIIDDHLKHPVHYIVSIYSQLIF